jgi:arabinan endo-1,5-alpha-L-arabinosidase
MKKKAFFLLIISNLLVSSLIGYAQEGRIGLHDPVMIKHQDKVYIFATGNGISVWSSTDMKNWAREKSVFDAPPQWTVSIMTIYALSDTAIRPFRGHLWAPDISYHNGLYHLYYSASNFGKNSSCMGLATNKTLDSSHPDFKWIDHGPVICSRPGIDNWNAIDPNLIYGEDGHPYLTWGSFWDGLQIARLTDDLKRIHPDSKPVTIASRKTDVNMPNPPAPPNNPVNAGGNAIEAPFIVRKGDYFYYFASIDYCCRGVNSTYKMIYGRSDKIMGSYYDKEGKSMRTGGGTMLMQGDKDWYGVGHNGFATIDGKDYLVFHAYDAHDERGASKLRIFEILWDADGWPVVGNAIY